MRERKFAVIGGDMRQVKLADLLALDGHAVSVFASDQARSESAVLAPSLRDCVEGVDCIVLPLPLLKGCEQINTPLSDTALTVSELFSLLTPSQIICGGRVPLEMYDTVSTHGLTLFDYFSREELVIANAAVTAEGAIGVAMEATPTALLGSSALVLGFGRIGKLLALRLRALGVHVTVAARSFSDLAWIAAYGYTAIHMDALDEHLSGYSILFNTAPHLLLDARRLALLDPATLCIDLASKPGGINFSAAASLGISTIWALGLPGKVAPRTSAAIIRDTIYNILSEQETIL